MNNTIFIFLWIFLNLIFGFINNCILDGFKNIFWIENKLPEVLAKYQRLRKTKVIQTFNRFYS